MIGTTGHAGHAALERFVAEGHEVVALVRPHHAAALVPRPGVEWLAATFEETDLISEATGRTDAAVQIGASHDSEMQRLDRGVIDAIAAAFAGSGKVFVSTSAGPVYGDTAGSPRDEHEPIENPHPLRAWRIQHDRDVVDLADRGIRGVVLRPGLIYGRAGGWVAGLSVVLSKLEERGT